ncbi:MAG: cbb3-type cytochrome c oxidase subunit II, partial [Rhodospirillales bacterium]|nr:cbb3-type cytochrome c oxidase subunit II [Rhodospirillales bacterium]
MLKHHYKLETNVVLLLICILATIIVGGLVEIVPLFTLKSTIEEVKGVRPYSPLQLAG